MAYYSVIVLICLFVYFISAIVVASADNGAARKGYKGKYNRAPAHYEIVIPHKVSETGDFISHTIPHHYKRNYYENKKQRSMGAEDMVHYMVPISGKKHHLQLLPNTDVVAPGMVVEIQDGKKTSKGKMHRLENVQCHYTGSVNGQKNSRAAVSTCYGLSGFIRTEDGDFIIEPAEGYDALSGEEHSHLLYSHETDPPVKEVNCKTTGNLPNILAKRTLNLEEDKTKTPKNVSEYHIEAMVVIDKTMLEYHKGIDVENYVLTVFNMAHALYHDASLGTNINLAIVRLIRLEEEENKLNLAVNKNAKKTLEFFQDWQNKMNPGDDTHPNHHDVAVLLTRIDICGDDNNCGILGASVIGGICDAKNQAALCEDNGLRLGFVIAHEIAHTLAIPHDDSKDSGCNATLPQGLSTVMNPSVNIRTSEWSRCSGKFLKMFIEQGYAKCLLDPPTDHSFEIPDILPGVVYGGDFQCKELLVPTASLCDVGIECDNLICYVEDKGCIETHTAAASGTNCGEKKWCFRGKCLEMGERPGAVDGGWSSWSGWSGCSRTCGAGVKTQERHCNNPAPAHSGKYCTGEHKQHKICNTQPCEVGSSSFRNVQCAEYNDWVYPEDNKVHLWKAYHMSNENPCILFCVNDQGDVASLRPRVEDGTKCFRGIRDICIDGICREIPCDLNLESNAVEDWCGVCRGNGTSCTVISGQQHLVSDKPGTSVKLIDIPMGSVNTKVEETEPSDSTIQVRAKSTNSTLLEGDTPGVYNVSGSKAWLGNIRTKQEALSIPGTIINDISIWILVTGEVTIKYSYGAPCAPKRTPVFDWDFLEWGKCSAQCGPGTLEAIPKCKEKMSGLVDDQYCKNKPKPKERIRPCEIAPCVPRWMIGDWQECTNCPHGNHVRFVKCVIPTGEGEGESDVISDYRCAPPKPKEREKCNCERIKTIIKRGDLSQKDSEQNVKFPPIEDDLQSTDLTTIGPIQNLEDVLSVAHLKVVVDKENPKDVNLTIHNDNVVTPDRCHPTNKSKSLNFSNKEGMKYISKLEKDLGSNKVKV